MYTRDVICSCLQRKLNAYKVKFNTKEIGSFLSFFLVVFVCLFVSCLLLLFLWLFMTNQIWANTQFFFVCVLYLTLKYFRFWAYIDWFTHTHIHKVKRKIAKTMLNARKWNIHLGCCHLANYVILRHGTRVRCIILE